MIESLLTAIGSFKPVAWRSAFAICLMTSAVIFMPEKFRETLGFAEIVEEQRTIIGLAFLLSSAISVIAMLDGVKHLASPIYVRWRYRKNLRGLIIVLSRNEKELLREYLENDVSTLAFPISGGTAPFLEGKGILSRSSSLGRPGSRDLFPYSIQPVALDIIRRNPELVADVI